MMQVFFIGKFSCLSILDDSEIWRHTFSCHVSVSFLKHSPKAIFASLTHFSNPGFQKV